ncbi:hypothetical protein A1D22_01845 [Pasteurellaceae bacterium LFhippo2]|nr:hypothetical protein [Pasteurellaceae bacterium LFhippo2]
MKLRQCALLWTTTIALVGCSSNYFKPTDEQILNVGLKTVAFDKCMVNEGKGDLELKAKKDMLIQVVSPILGGQLNAIHFFDHPDTSSYVHQRIKTFGNSFTVNGFSKEECKSLRSAFRSEVSQLKREAKAREDFLATPQGQAYVAQQQILQQQQQMQRERLAAENQARNDAVVRDMQNMGQQMMNRTKMTATNCFGQNVGFATTVNCTSF